MIEDISKSIKANMYERATSPLFGAFAITWGIWNYKVILAILSSLEIKEKVSYIETEIYGAEWSLLLKGAVCPLVSAILFILIYPHPAKWIYKYWSTQQKNLKEIKQQIEDKTPLTLDESRQIRRELLRLENDYEETITKKNTDIDRLKDIIATLENQAKPASQSSPAKSPIETVAKSADNKASQEILKKKDHSDLLSKGHISHRVITGVKVGDITYEMGKGIKTDEPGKVNIFSLSDSFKYEDVIPVKVYLDQPLEKDQWLSIFDSYSSRELTDLEFEVQKADFEDKDIRLSVVQRNPLKDNNNVVVSNIIQFAY